MGKNLADVTDEDLIRCGLMNPRTTPVDPDSPWRDRGDVMEFRTNDALQEHREWEAEMSRRRKQREEADQIYADVDAFVLPVKPWRQ